MKTISNVAAIAGNQVFRTFRLIACAVALAGCAAVPPAQAPIPIGTTVNNLFVFTGKQIPLPEGIWNVVGYQQYVNKGGTEVPKVALANIENNELKTFVAVSASAQSGASVKGGTGWFEGWQASTYCSKKNIHHVEIIANFEQGDQDCWLVDHIQVGLRSDSAPWAKQAWQYMISNKIKTPINMLRVYYNVADRSHLLNVDYYFNPEAEGFAAPVNSSYADSDWHPSRVYMDQKKVAYLRKIIDWGKEWHPKIVAGFRGNLPMSTSLPDTKVSPAPASASERLKAVDELLRQRLITPEDAAKKREEILKSL